MPSAKLLIGGAGAAALGVRVARSLYGRWRLLPAADRQRHRSRSPRTPRRTRSTCAARPTAAAGRGATCARPTRRSPRRWSRRAEADPEIDARRSSALREDLRRELERLAGADIKASAKHRAPSRRRTLAPPG